MIELPEITICTVGTESYREQMQNALDYSCREIKFGDVKNIIIEIKDFNDWNRFVVFDLDYHIDTKFALVVHPDGFVVHPECWRDEFMEYDYIGSPWPIPNDDYSYRDINGVLQRVGNAVSLRSKKVLGLPKHLNMEWKPFHGLWHEDGYIAVNMRHLFEENGCKYAPLEVAKYFGREYEVPENRDVDKTFVFHKHFGRNSIYPNFET